MADSENGSIGSAAAPTPPASKRSSKVDATETTLPKDPDLPIRRRLAWGEAEKGGEPEREEEKEEEVKLNKGNGTNKQYVHQSIYPSSNHFSFSGLQGNLACIFIYFLEVSEPGV